MTGPDLVHPQRLPSWFFEAPHQNNAQGPTVYPGWPPANFETSHLANPSSQSPKDEVLKRLEILEQHISNQNKTIGYMINVLQSIAKRVEKKEKRGKK